MLSRTPPARARVRRVRVNPRRLKPLHGVDPKSAAVKHYERHPNTWISDESGYPFATVGWFGGLNLQNGHHRRQAAINQGRPLDVWVPA